MSSEGQVTQMLRAASEGNGAAAAKFIPLLYDELRRRAYSYMRMERRDHTLQPTALVHEAYLKLIGQEVDWKSRSHFLGVAAQQMRRILVDHARRHMADKRGGNERKLSFEYVLAIAGEQPHDLIAVHEALEIFATDFPRQARVVELRFFGGNTEDEVSHILGISPETVKRDWKFAKSWLSHEIRLGK